MGLGRTFLGWPVMRQLTGADRLGRGAAAESAHTRAWTARTETVDRVVKSVCPYCAVGCGLLVSVKDGQVVNVEGNPDSPINRGTLCPKGAATYQLMVNPNRLTKVWYRAPGATEWDTTKTLDWAMDRIANLTKQTRDATFVESVQMSGPDGKPQDRRVNHTRAIVSLGGATLDIEWNYIQAKLMRALGVVGIENQARI
jgi:formate dehydrogenase major subunit